MPVFLRQRGGWRRRCFTNGAGIHFLNSMQQPDGMRRPPQPTCKTTNWYAYNKALKQRGSLTAWFNPSMLSEAMLSGRRLRQQARIDAAIQACVTIKVLVGLLLRQTNGFVASLLELSGLGRPVPDFITLSGRQKTLDLTIACCSSKGGPLRTQVSDFMAIYDFTQRLKTLGGLAPTNTSSGSGHQSRIVSYRNRPTNCRD